MIGLADFKGEWALSRRIYDARAGQEGSFEGRAWFRADAEGLLYSEQGQLVLPGQRAFKAQRHYLWRAAAGQIAVLFHDGRPFHTFNPAVRAPGASHICVNDTYHVAYDFNDWPRWSARWQVAGPTKGYVMVSCYAPCAGAETEK